MWKITKSLIMLLMIVQENLDSDGCVTQTDLPRYQKRICFLTIEVLTADVILTREIGLQVSLGYCLRQ